MNKLLASLAISFLLLQFFFIVNLSGSENLEEKEGKGKRNLYVYSTTSDGNYDTQGDNPFTFSPTSWPLNDLMLEQAMIDFYEDKKKLSDENKTLHHIISEQAKEIYEKEDIQRKVNTEDKIESDEINRLNELLSQQAKEIEEKDNALIKEKKESGDLLEEKIIAKYLLSLELKKKEEQLIEEQQKKQEMERREREDRERREREKENESKVARETIRIVKQTNNEVKRFIRKF